MSQKVILSEQTISLFSGEENKYFCDNIDIIKSNPRDHQKCNEALKTINGILSRCFNIKVSSTILDTRYDNDFFGVNIYPEYKDMRRLIDIICNDYSENEIVVDEVIYEKPIDAVKAVWRDIHEWHMDLDAKLFYDLSHRFNPKEIVALILYQIEQTVFSYDTPINVYRGIKFIMLNSSYTTQALSRATICRNFYIIPFIQACGFVNFRSVVCADSIINQSESLLNDYNGFLNKVVTFYSSSLIDRPENELRDKISYILNWVFESINDLKHQMFILKKHLKEQIVAEKSFYVKNLLTSIYKQFASNDINSVTTESFMPVTEERKVLNEKMELARIEKIFKPIIESAESNMLDKNGKCKRVTDENIDILRLEIGKIENIDDKIYYMEKVYDYLNIVNYSLDLLTDKDSRHRVRDSKDKLEKQKEALMKIREAIINKQVGVERYGLFMKTRVPEGYEG